STRSRERGNDGNKDKERRRGALPPPLPSSNRTGRFPASGFPESFRRKHAQGAPVSLQQSQAEVLQLGVVRHSFRRPEGTLTPTLQMTRERENHVRVHRSKRH